MLNPRASDLWVCRSCFKRLRDLGEWDIAHLDAKTEGSSKIDYFRERAARANPAKAKAILKRAGRGNPPMPGDEI